MVDTVDRLNLCLIKDTVAVEVVKSKEGLQVERITVEVLLVWGGHYSS